MTSVILARNDSEMPGLHGNMTNSRNDKSAEAPAKEADQSKPEKPTTTKEHTIENWSGAMVSLLSERGDLEER